MQRKILGAVCALAALAGAPAIAAPQGYVTVGVGSSKVDIDCTGTNSCDNTDTAAKVVAGWEFARDVAAEVSYNYLGQAKANLTVLGEDFDVKIKGDYVGLGLAWRPQFGATAFGAVVRTGVAFVNTRSEVVDAGSISHSSTHPYFGLGLTYAIDKNWGVELAWDRTRVSTDDGEGGDADATSDTFTLAGTYHF